MKKYSFTDIYNLQKQAAAMLTPQAQAAAMPPPAPPMPPQGGAPMDPSMLGGAPAGDPATMGGGMPPPGAWMQDPMFAEFLMSIGFQQGPDGNFIDPNGQPIPPQMMDQIYMQYLMQMQSGGMPPQGGAPMDPAMAGGMPPADPAAMSGDPAAMGGIPPEGQMPPAELPPEIMEQISGMVQDIISSEFEQRFSTLDKKITAFNQKLDTIKTLLDDILVGGAKQSNEKAQEDSVNAQLERQLRSSRQTESQPLQSTQQMLTSRPSGNILDIMRG